MPEIRVKIKKVRRRRKISTYQRLLVAYKQSYKCNGCYLLLPPAFQLDHVIDLRDGGLDCRSNMQALCANCHAEKTAKRADQISQGQSESCQI